MFSANTSHDRYQPKVVNPNGDHPVLFVCEHAAADIPEEFQSLGLGNDELQSHIAWDPGALSTAEALATRLNAPLLHTSVSRLVYDCNRPPEAPDAMPVRSESTDIPGNRAMTAQDRQSRIDLYYRPFEKVLSELLDIRPSTRALVTIHSFTPIFLGASRGVEIGILHDTDTRLADVLLDLADGFRIARNEPYGPNDGVTHTLKRHALPRGLPNVMLEIRNDLLATPKACTAMAEKLAGWLDAALALQEFAE